MKPSAHVSIIVPAYNEEGNILELVKRTDRAMRSANIEYEMVFIDDLSTDNTRGAVKNLSRHYPISLHSKQGKRGKAQSLLQGFAYARYPLFAILDADLQYPPEAFPKMVKEIQSGYDVVIASRKRSEESWMRRLSGGIFFGIFVKLLHNLEADSQSGQKLFKKEILAGMDLNPTPWAFDLEFLLQARDLGYRIGSVDIVFSPRHYGSSKVNVLKTTYELGSNALSLKWKRIWSTPPAYPLRRSSVP